MKVKEIKEDKNRALPPIKYDISEAAIQKMRDAVFSLPETIKTNTERKEAAAVKSDIVKSRTLIETRRKELKRDALEYGRTVDSIAKEITAQIKDVEEVVAERIKAYDEIKAEEKRLKEEAEQKRKDYIRDQIRGFRDFVKDYSTLNEYEAAQNTLKNIAIGDDFEEFYSDAIIAKREALNEIESRKELFVQKEKEEAERKEREAQLKIEREKLEREKAELEKQQEAERKEREAQEEKARLEKEKLDEERRKIEEEKAALEKAKIEAERKEREAQEEKERIERVKAARAKNAKLRKERVEMLVKILKSGMKDPEKFAADILDGKVDGLSFEDKGE